MTPIHITRRELTAMHERLGLVLEGALEQHAPWELVEALIESSSRLESRILADAARRTMKWSHEAACDLEAARRTLVEVEAWTLEVSAQMSARR